MVVGISAPKNGTNPSILHNTHTQLLNIGVPASPLLDHHVHWKTAISGYSPFPMSKSPLETLPSTPPPFSHEISTISGTFLALYCTVWPRPTGTFKAWNFNGWPSPPTHPRPWNLSAHRGSKLLTPTSCARWSDLIWGMLHLKMFTIPLENMKLNICVTKKTFYIILPCGGFLKWNPSDHASHRCLLGNQGNDWGGWLHWFSMVFQS